MHTPAKRFRTAKGVYVYGAVLRYPPRTMLMVRDWRRPLFFVSIVRDRGYGSESAYIRAYVQTGGGGEDTRKEFYDFIQKTWAHQRVQADNRSLGFFEWWQILNYHVHTIQRAMRKLVALRNLRRIDLLVETAPQPYLRDVLAAMNIYSFL